MSTDYLFVPLHTPAFQNAVLTRKPSHEVAPTTLATFQPTVNVRLAVTYLRYTIIRPGCFFQPRSLIRAVTEL